MTDRKLIRSLRKKLREGERMLTGIDSGSDLHDRLSFRLTQLRKIIKELTA